MKKKKKKILDMITREALGPGQEGEIVCKSLALMNGYFSNDEATFKAFDEDGWFLTGDVGKITEDGVLYITGRIKGIIRGGGYKIFPDKIESVIQCLSGVMEVAVAEIPVDQSYLLMALVVKEESSDLCEEHICKIVQENLPNFMWLRAGVYFVDYIPKTSNGKLQRHLIQQVADALCVAK